MPVKTINEINLSEEDTQRVSRFELVDNEDGISIDKVPIYLEDTDKKGLCESIKIVQNQLLLKVIKGTSTDLECKQLIALNSCSDND